MSWDDARFERFVEATIRMARHQLPGYGRPHVILPYPPKEELTCIGAVRNLPGRLEASGLVAECVAMAPYVARAVQRYARRSLEDCDEYQRLQADFSEPRNGLIGRTLDACEADLKAKSNDGRILALCRLGASVPVRPCIRLSRGSLSSWRDDDTRCRLSGDGRRDGSQLPGPSRSHWRLSRSYRHLTYTWSSASSSLPTEIPRRPLNEVINTEEAIDPRSEIDEYVFTPHTENYLRTLIEGLLDTSQGHIPDCLRGWISGFFGSGKSHFMKLAGALLENRLLVLPDGSETSCARIRSAQARPETAMGAAGEGIQNPHCHGEPRDGARRGKARTRKAAPSPAGERNQSRLGILICTTCGCYRARDQEAQEMGQLPRSGANPNGEHRRARLRRETLRMDAPRYPRSCLRSSPHSRGRTATGSSRNTRTLGAYLKDKEAEQPSPDAVIQLASGAGSQPSPGSRTRLCSAWTKLPSI